MDLPNSTSLPSLRVDLTPLLGDIVLGHVILPMSLCLAYVQVDPVVSAHVHYVCSLYWKQQQEFAEFYKSSLMYLAFVPVDSLAADLRKVKPCSIIPSPLPPPESCFGLLCWFGGGKPPTMLQMGLITALTQALLSPADHGRSGGGQECKPWLRRLPAAD